MFCLTFKEKKEYYFSDSSITIPVISPGEYKFYSRPEPPLKFNRENYSTTLYFYFNSTKINNYNCFLIVNDTKEINNCSFIKSIS